MPIGGPRRGLGGPGHGVARGARRQRRRRRRRRTILVGGAIAFGAHKLSQKDVKKVEEHTGQDWESLSDDEINKSIDELGIEKQPMDEADKQTEQSAESTTDVERSSSESHNTDNYMDELEKLSELKDKGILTEEEFSAKKKKLLGL